MTMQDIVASSTAFTVAYDGDALSEHRMSAHEIETALVTVGDLFNRANLLLNGEGTSIELEVRATPPDPSKLNFIWRRFITWQLLCSRAA